MSWVFPARCRQSWAIGLPSQSSQQAVAVFMSDIRHQTGRGVPGLWLVNPSQYCPLIGWGWTHFSLGQHRTWVTLISDRESQSGRSRAGLLSHIWWTMLMLEANKLRYCTGWCVCVASQLKDNVDSYWCLRQCEQWPGETPLVRWVAP